MRKLGSALADIRENPNTIQPGRGPVFLKQGVLCVLSVLCVLIFADVTSILDFNSQTSHP